MPTILIKIQTVSVRPITIGIKKTMMKFIVLIHNSSGAGSGFFVRATELSSLVLRKIISNNSNVCYSGLSKKNSLLKS